MNYRQYGNHSLQVTQRKGPAVRYQAAGVGRTRHRQLFTDAVICSTGIRDNQGCALALRVLPERCAGF
jgi:hypothetical protein